MCRVKRFHQRALCAAAEGSSKVIVRRVSTQSYIFVFIKHLRCVALDICVSTLNHFLEILEGK